MAADRTVRPGATQPAAQPGRRRSHVASFLSTISGPIVLIGHSYGGAVITNAATGNAQREDAGTCGRSHRTKVRRSPARRPGLRPRGGPDNGVRLRAVPRNAGRGRRSLPQAGRLPDLLRQRSTPRHALPLYAAQRPFAFSAGNQPSGPAAWQTIPSWYQLTQAVRQCRATGPTGPRGVLPCVDCRLIGRRCHPRLR